MAKISLDTVRSLINYLTQQGLSRSLLLQHLSFTEAQINQSRQLVDTQIYQRLFQFGEEQLSNPYLGFEFGQQIEAERWGVLGYIAFTSATLAEALNHQRKFQRLVGNVGSPVVEEQNGILTIKWIPATKLSHHVAEDIITGWVALARKLTLTNLKPLSLDFSHPAAGDVQPYEDYFSCPVNFNKDVHAIRVSSEVLGLQSTRHEPEINHLLCQHADKILCDLVEQLPIQVMEDYIRDQLPIGMADIESTAEYMRTSVRTLQRKLEEKQLTFSQVLDKVRQEMAISYLQQTDTKVVYIAQMLGFSEQSAFQRAFKRWTGQTPKQFRNGF